MSDNVVDAEASGARLLDGAKKLLSQDGLDFPTTKLSNGVLGRLKVVGKLASRREFAGALALI